jgi:hypothetical protein
MLVTSLSTVASMSSLPKTQTCLFRELNREREPEERMANLDTPEGERDVERERDDQSVGR